MAFFMSGRVVWTVTLRLRSPPMVRRVKFQNLVCTHSCATLITPPPLPQISTAGPAEANTLREGS